MAVGTTNFPTSLDDSVSLPIPENNASSTLAAGINASALTITITDPNEFPDAGEFTIVDDLDNPTQIENVKIESRSGSDFTVEAGGRGAGGTTAQTWSSGAFIECRPNKLYHTSLRGLSLALSAKTGIGASTPTANTVLRGTGAGTSAWGAIVNADVSASAAIAYSKLNLSGSILNADINASAAIAHSKMAALTASRLMVTDGSGFASAASVTSTEAGYLSGVTSAIQTQLDAKLSGNQTITLSGDVSGSGATSITATIGASKVTNSMLAGSIAISKLSITGTPDGTKFLRDDGSWATASGGGGSITVREVDGTPSVASVTTIEFAQGSGFVVTDQTGGVARVDLAAIPDSALATISTAGKVSDSALSANVTLLGNSTTGTGAIVRATSPTLTTPVLGVASATSLAVTGTGGNGFVSIVAQSSAPGTPGSGFALFADSSGRFSWVRSSDGFVRKFDATLTADRTYTLPDVSGTVVTSGNLTAITATGTIASGTWNGSVIGSSYGGAGSVSGILKADGAGTVSAASAGTDYVVPSVTTLSSLTTVGTITSGGLGTGAVIGGVTMTLGSDGTGDIYYRSAGGVLTRLAAGTNGHVLTLSSGLPAWQAASGGGLTIGTTAIASGTAGRILYEDASNKVNEIAGSSVSSAGSITLAPSAVSGGAVGFQYTPGAHTAVTAEVNDFYIPAHTMTVTGAIATQRFTRFGIPTITAASSLTTTTAATVSIDGPPAAAGSAVITNAAALLIQNGAILASGATNAYSFSASTNSAMFYSAGGGDIRYSVQGYNGPQFHPTRGIIITGDNSANYGWRNGSTYGDPDTGLARFGVAVVRVTDGSTGGGQLLVGGSTATTVSAQLHVVSGSASRVGLRVDSASNPSVDILQATVNGSTTAGAYMGVAKGGTIFAPRATYTGVVGSTALNLANGNFQTFTFGAGNETITLSNIPNSAYIIIAMIQDGTGSRTATWPATIKWVGGAAPTLTTTAGARDVFIFSADGTNLYEVARALDVK